MTDKIQPDDTTRRKIIVTTGGFALAGLGSGTASAAKGGKEKGKGKGSGGEDDKRKDKGGGEGGRGSRRGNNTCPDGTVLLAKYEVKGGKFVYEKGGNYLDVNDSFEFMIDGTKDGGEILAFTVEDPDGVYNIDALSVKTGAGVFTKETSGTSVSFDVRDYDKDGPVQAISNVLICSEVYWQVDFGKGTIPEPPRYSDGGLGNLVLAATGNSSTEEVVNPFRNYDDSRGYVDVPSDPFDIDFDSGTATIDFEDNTADDRLHLAIFKTPGPLSPKEDFPEIEFQELYDKEYTTAGEGSMTVDLPTPADFS